MQNYNFKKGVYLVEGHANSCIYDLNKCSMYSINNELKDALIELIKNKRVVDEELLLVVEQLVNYGILEPNAASSEIADIKEIGVKKEITSAWVKVTEKCNLTCIHCFEEASAKCMAEMKMDDFKMAIDQLAELNVPLVQLYGGEPLLLQDKLVEMLAYCTEKIEKVEIFTNLTLINDEWIRVFKKYNPFIIFSLYSSNSDDHDRVTKVKGSHQKVMQAMELLDKNDIDYSFTMILMDGINPGEMKETNCRVSTEIVKVAGRAGLTLLNDELLKEKLITRETFEKPLRLDLIKKSVTQNNCFCKQLFVDTNLDVYPCNVVKQIKHGNLKEGQLADLLKSEIMEFNKDKIDVCNQCEYRYACFDCRVDTLDGNITAKTWYCTYDPLTGEWEDEDAFISRLGAS